MKALAAHVLNDHTGQHVAMRVANETLVSFEHKSVWKPIYLHGRAREVSNGAAVFSLWDKDIAKVYTSRTLMTTTGLVSEGDTVFAPSTCKVFVTQTFLEVWLVSGSSTFMAQVTEHKWKEACLFEPSTSTSMVIWEEGFKPVTSTLRSCALFMFVWGGWTKHF